MNLPRIWFITSIDLRALDYIVGCQILFLGSMKGYSDAHPGDASPTLGFPGGSVVKNPPANAGDTGSIPGSGRSPGGGNGRL